MDIEVTGSKGRSVIRLQGRFDFAAHRQFSEAREKAMARQEREIEVNLAGIEYLDSSALGMLLILRDTARAAGKSVALADCRGATWRAIEMANFHRVFDILPGDSPAAAGALASHQGAGK